jgi:hypothetical protein
LAGIFAIVFFSLAACCAFFTLRFAAGADDGRLRHGGGAAQRSLGTAQNDATTAVQVINRLHDCLSHLAPRPFPPAINWTPTASCG